ncbi:hypothetical protein KLA_05532 [Cellulophaga geojensis KL-A]|uniref:Uncharacterized protein n=1 Tax=Cellulophaga geojensis KL-A TaxID=1328323 RepID=A0ABN0RQB9_9FLAO|nr:hypothetical protein [Cellulophaga geojensis]EWH14106.1 hypothetical protein KLA_05532 [Cellulophaga geojensis KL-A]
MKYNGLLGTFPSEIKLFIGAFVVILSIGFYTGLMFVNETTGAKPAGITENYLGNEEDEDAEVMKFKKSKREMLTTVHTHILSMSFIFFLLGGLVWLIKLPKKLKLFLTIEPFLSVLLTFGGIYLLWSGLLWMKYIIMISGALMTLTFTLSALVILWQLIKKQATT